MKKLTDEQANILYEHLKFSLDPKDVIIQICFETGCRISEALALGVNSLVGNILAIDPLKNSNFRQVAITPNLQRKLESLSDQKRYINKATETRNRDSQRRAMDRHFKALTLKLFQDPKNLHSLRHTCFTRLYNQTHDILMVRDWAGHKSLKSTLVYLEDSRKEKANEAMMEILC